MALLNESSPTLSSPCVYQYIQTACLAALPRATRRSATPAKNDRRHHEVAPADRATAVLVHRVVADSAMAYKKRC